MSETCDICNPDLIEENLIHFAKPVPLESKSVLRNAISAYLKCIETEVSPLIVEEIVQNALFYMCVNVELLKTTFSLTDDVASAFHCIIGQVLDALNDT